MTIRDINKGAPGSLCSRNSERPLRSTQPSMSLGLMVDPKQPSSIAMTSGQNRGFRALAAQGNTVIVFWGQCKDGSDITHMLVHQTGREPRKVEATLADLRAEAAAWFKHANSGRAA